VAQIADYRRINRQAPPFVPDENGDAPTPWFYQGDWQKVTYAMQERAGTLLPPFPEAFITIDDAERGMLVQLLIRAWQHAAEALDGGHIGAAEFDTQEELILCWIVMLKACQTFLDALFPDDQDAYTRDGPVTARQRYEHAMEMRRGFLYRFDQMGWISARAQGGARC
jgi:hypothetical protein